MCSVAPYPGTPRPGGRSPTGCTAPGDVPPGPVTSAEARIRVVEMASADDAAALPSQRPGTTHRPCPAAQCRDHAAGPQPGALHQGPPGRRTRHPGQRDDAEVITAGPDPDPGVASRHPVTVEVQAEVRQPVPSHVLSLQPRP